MFRVRRANRRNPPALEKPNVNPTVDLPIPEHFRCPISLELMKDPVTLYTGITYDRKNIETWLDAGNRTCPVTHQELENLEQIPNHVIRKMIQEWCVANRSLGIERIPTPRIPITPFQVSKIFMEIASSSQNGNLIQCWGLVKKMNALVRESDRNLQCIASNEEGGRILSAAFESFAVADVDSHAEGMEEILSLLAWMFPLDNEARSNLVSHASLQCMVRFLKRGSLAGRRNAALALKEVAMSSEQRVVDSLAEMEGLMEALVMVLREPICRMTTKASLMAIFYLISSSSMEKIAPRFVEMGMVSLLLEMLIDSEKRVSEMALSVLDGVFGCEEGRDEAYGHALTLPVLVKKIFRVSDLATNFTISALWKLCKNYKGEDGRILMEGLQVGAFQKVLLVLQVGCTENTKEKATDLLKLLNPYVTRGECIDSMDFKPPKRPF